MLNAPSVTSKADAKRTRKLQTLARETTHPEIARQVDQAIEKIQNGTYLRCSECDASIGYSRLNAIPYALHCISCQTKFDTASKVAKDKNSDAAGFSRVVEDERKAQKATEEIPEEFNNLSKSRKSL